MKKICVIGAGGTGQCFAADMALAGHDVAIFDNRVERIEEIEKAGGILLSGGGRTGKAQVKPCYGVAEALESAGLVVVCAVSERHAILAELCAPHLKDGQTVFISAGNAASLIFDKAIRDARGLAPESRHGVVLGELEGNLYPCRRLRPAQIFMCFPLVRRNVAAFPASDTPKLQAALEGVLETNAANNVFETALNSPNVVIHLMGSLLNLSAVDSSRGEFWLYKTGLTPSVLSMLAEMDSEKNRIYEAWGWTPRSPMEHMERVSQQDKFPELNAFRGLIGPTAYDHRYFTEDASTGICLLASVADLAGVDAPLSKSIMHLTGALHKKDYINNGRTLEALGLGGLSKDEVMARLLG